MSEDRLTRRTLLRGMAVGGTASAIGAGTAGGTEQDRYIVGTKDVAGAGAAKRKATQVHREFDFGDVGNAVSGRFPEEAHEALERRPDVRYIERDGRMRAVGQTLGWGVDHVDADLAHDDGVTGEGADIAILDTGIDPDHPDLEANLGTGKAFYDCGTNVDGSSCSTSSDCTEPWADDNDHGTHCAGIAAAVDNTEGVIGVAPSATLHAVRVLDCNAWGYYSEIAAGLEYVADQGWDVASMSLGGTSGSSTLQDACQYAADNGVLVVAAAGNAGPCSDCVRYPAAYDSVMAVSATDSNDALASFSCTGPEIELAAPGVYIESTVRGGTETWSGTSMACPHVSGAAGLLMANGYTAQEAREKVGSTAEDIGLGPNEQGNGLLNGEAALKSATTFNVDTLITGDMTISSSKLNGKLTGMGDADSVDVLFSYWVKNKKSETQGWTGWQTLRQPATFSAGVDGLDGGETYVTKAIARRNDTGDYNGGGEREFATNEPFNIDTLATENIKTSSASFNGELMALGGANSADVLFSYWVKNEKSTTEGWTTWQTFSSASSFSASVDGLQSEMSYVVKAIGRRNDTGSYDSGEEREFKI